MTKKDPRLTRLGLDRYNQASGRPTTRQKSGELLKKATKSKPSVWAGRARPPVTLKRVKPRNKDEEKKVSGTPRQKYRERQNVRWRWANKEK